MAYIYISTLTFPQIYKYVNPNPGWTFPFEFPSSLTFYFAKN